ncbi:MAG: hypothetical protein K1X74_14380 [Pirellulales bacterium]|nr:hypothetical protein [Pirellulales bacterium]
MYLIGTDEAGFGPNFGPLVVAATAWEIPDHCADAGLYELAPGAITSAFPPRGASDRRVIVADSKALYSPQRGLASIERGVLAACRAAGLDPQTWQELWPLLAPDDADALAAQPGHDDYDRALPMAVDPAQLDDAAACLEQGLAQAGVRLCGIRAAVIDPRRFNELVARRGTKGAVLSEVTICLARQLLERCPTGTVRALCDKHGGRNRYAALLQEFATDAPIATLVERAELSHYRWRQDDRMVEFRFRPRGECEAPTALASMTAKYLRELAMEAFNAFWQRHVPDLRRTAGYPTDARRFRAEIAAAQAALGIDDHSLWRNV